MIMSADGSGMHVNVEFRHYFGAESVTSVACCARSQRVAVAADGAIAMMHLSRAGRCFLTSLVCNNFTSRPPLSTAGCSMHHCVFAAQRKSGGW